jgi:hypothetical protein
VAQFQTPVAKPSSKDQCAMRVELIALSLIAIVAAFTLLPTKCAIIMTAIIVVGSMRVLCTQDPVPKARYHPPKGDGRIGNVIFNSVEDARRFQATCNERYSEHLECLDSGIIELNKIIHYHSNVDADSRARITEEIRSLIR